MNRSLFLLLSLLFMICSSPSNVTEDDRYFDSANLKNLSLDNIPSFWKGCSLNVHTDCYPLYCVCDGHIDQRFYSSGPTRLGVVVFKDQSYAFEAAEYLIKNCSAVFKRGDSTTGKTWWFFEDLFESCIIYVKYNTFIEVSPFTTPHATTPDSLWSVINEVENRMNRFIKNSPTAPQGKYFNTKDLKSLDLPNIDAFWQGDSIMPFNRYIEGSRIGLRLKDIGYSSVTDISRKTISVTVFKNTDIAIQTIRDWKSTSQAITYYGNPKDPIEGLWRFEGESITPSYTTIVVQKWNTVAEVSYYPTNNELILSTVSDILKKIDELSK